MKQNSQFCKPATVAALLLFFFFFFPSPPPPSSGAPPMRAALMSGSRLFSKRARQCTPGQEPGLPLSGQFVHRSHSRPRFSSPASGLRGAPEPPLGKGEVKCLPSPLTLSFKNTAVLGREREGGGSPRTPGGISWGVCPAPLLPLQLCCQLLSVKR